jgi:hypothetical protein
MDLPGLLRAHLQGGTRAMRQSSTLATFAAAGEAMATVVDRINTEMGRLQAAGAEIDPQTVRYGAATGDGSRLYVGSFVYAQTDGEESTP